MLDGPMIIPSTMGCRFCNIRHPLISTYRSPPLFTFIHFKPLTFVEPAERFRGHCPSFNFTVMALLPASSPVFIVPTFSIKVTPVKTGALGL